MSSPPHPSGPALPTANTVSPSPASAISLAAPAISTSTVTAPTVRSLSNFLPNPSPHQPQQQILDTVPIRPKSSPQRIVYPVASSGLAFIPHKPLVPSEGTVTIASPDPSNRPIMPFTPSKHLLQTHHAATVALPVSVPPKMVSLAISSDCPSHFSFDLNCSVCVICEFSFLLHVVKATQSPARSSKAAANGFKDPRY